MSHAFGKGPAACAGADKATYGEAMMVTSFNDLRGDVASLREGRFGLRFKVRAGDSLGESGTAMNAWREESRGGVGGRESIFFFLPAGRALMFAICCGTRGRGDE